MVKLRNVFESKFNCNVIISSCVLAVILWIILGSQYATTTSSDSLDTIMIVLFGLIAVAIGVFTVTYDIKQRTTKYGIISCVLCLTMIPTMVFLSQRISIPLTVLALGLVLVFYNQIIRDMLDIK